MDDLFDNFSQQSSAQPQAESAAKSNEANLFDSSDPAAEFLANEQAELDRIENNSQDFLADNNNQFSNGSSQAANFLNDENNNQNKNNQENGKSGEDWIVVDNQKAQEQSKDLYSSISLADRLSQEADNIKKWREEQQTLLANKDAEEERKKQELKQTAKKELEEWYQKRQLQLEQTLKNLKIAEAELQNDKSSEKEWDRVTKLCDFNQKSKEKTGRDVSRMRGLLLQLKERPLVR